MSTANIATDDLREGDVISLAGFGWQLSLPVCAVDVTPDEVRVEVDLGGACEWQGMARGARVMVERAG
jgi:hypothetical protein